MTNTLQSLAAEMAHAFESATRTNGEPFRKLADAAPAWMTTICRKAHDDAHLLPDDWRYQFIEEAINALADQPDSDAARDGLEPDIYTSDLTGWLHSRNGRVYYLGEALRDYGTLGDGFQLLAAAQLLEKLETFDQAVAALRDELANRDDGDTQPNEE